MPLTTKTFATLTLLFLPTLAFAQTTEKITPLMLSVQDAPIPFQGSDAHTHLVYELELKNFTASPLTIEKLEVLAPGPDSKRSHTMLGKTSGSSRCSRTAMPRSMAVSLSVIFALKGSSSMMGQAAVKRATLDSRRQP